MTMRQKLKDGMVLRVDFKKINYYDKMGVDFIWTGFIVLELWIKRKWFFKKTYLLDILESVVIKEIKQNPRTSKKLLLQRWRERKTSTIIFRQSRNSVIISMSQMKEVIWRRKRKKREYWKKRYENMSEEDKMREYQ